MPGVDRKHEYRCKDCGYGAIARMAPEQCPMCGSGAWELAPWRPFSDVLSPAAQPERHVAEARV